MNEQKRLTIIFDLHTPTGGQPMRLGSWLEHPAAPRKGDFVTFGTERYEVVTVTWQHNGWVVCTVVKR